MNDLRNHAVTLALPTLSVLNGVKSVTDASSKLGRAALEVEFIDGTIITIARDEISRNHFCIWLPERQGQYQTVMPKLTEVEVMTVLDHLAQIAANSVQIHTE